MLLSPDRLLRLQDHENVKYLPGYILPDNLIAGHIHHPLDSAPCKQLKGGEVGQHSVSQFLGGNRATCTPLTALSLFSEACIEKAVAGANILVFVIPHQFIGGLCEKICKNVAPDCIGVSLIKGLDFDDKGLVLISDIISDRLGEMSMSKARMSNTRHRNRVIFAPATVWKWNPPGRQRLACIEEGRATCALPKILVFVHRELISESWTVKAFPLGNLSAVRQVNQSHIQMLPTQVGWTSAF